MQKIFNSKTMLDVVQKIFPYDLYNIYNDY